MSKVKWFFFKDMAWPKSSALGNYIDETKQNYISQYSPRHHLWSGVESRKTQIETKHAGDWLQPTGFRSGFDWMPHCPTESAACDLKKLILILWLSTLAAPLLHPVAVHDGQIWFGLEGVGHVFPLGSIMKSVWLGTGGAAKAQQVTAPGCVSALQWLGPQEVFWALWGCKT